MKYLFSIVFTMSCFLMSGNAFADQNISAKKESGNRNEINTDSKSNSPAFESLFSFAETTKDEAKGPGTKREKASDALKPPWIEYDCWVEGNAVGGGSRKDSCVVTADNGDIISGTSAEGSGTAMQNAGFYHLTCYTAQNTGNHSFTFYYHYWGTVSVEHDELMAGDAFSSHYVKIIFRAGNVYQSVIIDWIAFDIATMEYSYNDTAIQVIKNIYLNEGDSVNLEAALYTWAYSIADNGAKADCEINFYGNLEIIEVDPPQAPSVDLSVLEIYTEPNAFYLCDEIKIHTKIKNLGADNCADPFWLLLYFDDVPIDSLWIRSLNNDHELNLVFNDFKWPCDCDSHQIKVWVDPYNQIPEADTNNNMMESVFSANLSELIFATKPDDCGTIMFDSIVFGNEYTTMTCNGLYDATAQTCEGYKFIDWTTSGGVTISNPIDTTTKVLVKGNGTLTANFSPVQHDIEFYAVPYDVGKINFNDVDYTNGQIVKVSSGVYQLSAEDIPGYVFDYWKANGENIYIADTADQRTEVTINGQGSISAHYQSQSQYAVTFGKNPSQGGQIFFDHSEVQRGGKIIRQTGNYTIYTPDSTAFTYWIVEGNIIIENSTMPSTEVIIGGEGTITANFNPEPASLIWQPEVHDFGYVINNADSDTINFALFNVGGEKATGTIALEGDVSSFTIISPPGGGPFELEAGTAMYLDVVANPDSSGQKVALIKASGSGFSAVSTELHAFGLDSIIGFISVLPQTFNPFPPSGSLAVNLNTQISFQAGVPGSADSVTYSIYLHHTYPPTLLTILGPLPANQQQISFNADSILLSNTVYYWYVVTEDNYGQTTQSPLWIFETESLGYKPYRPVRVYPSDTAVFTGLNPLVSAFFDDPEGDTIQVSFYKSLGDTTFSIDTEADWLEGIFLNTQTNGYGFLQLAENLEQYGDGTSNITLQNDTIMTEDWNVGNLTLLPGCTLSTNGFTLRVANTLTNYGVITDHFSGGAGGAGGNGGTGGDPYNSIPPTEGISGDQGNAPSIPKAGFGGSGGGGGGGGGGAFRKNLQGQITWDSNGGAGGIGGQGGNGGGYVQIYAKNFDNQGTIHADGKSGVLGLNGENGDYDPLATIDLAGGGGGGGGGGNGGNAGTVGIFYYNLVNQGTVRAHGGLPGNGGTGGSGHYLQYGVIIGGYENGENGGYNGGKGGNGEYRKYYSSDPGINGSHGYSGANGEVYLNTSVYHRPGIYVSKEFDAGDTVDWISVDIDKMLPSGISLEIQYGIKVGYPFVTWKWYNDLSEVPASRYLKLRLKLSATNNYTTPLVNKIEVQARKREFLFSQDDVTSGSSVNFFWNDLEPGENYEWYAVSYDGNYFQVSPAYPFGTINYNDTPYTPVNQFPENGSVNVSTDSLIFKWSGGDPDTLDYVQYYVFLDTIIEPYHSSSFKTDFLPATLRDIELRVDSLKPYTTYYWKILAIDNNSGSSAGETTSFTTVCNDVTVMIEDKSPTFTLCDSVYYNDTTVKAENYQSIIWTTSGDGTFSSPEKLNTAYKPGTDDIAYGTVDLWIKATAFSDCSGDSACINLYIVPIPIAYAGDNAIICEGDTYMTSSATAGYYSSLLWTTSGDGTFDNTTDTLTNYIPGPNDIEEGSVTLRLTAFQKPPCQNSTSSEVTITIQKQPDAVLQANDSICSKGICQLHVAGSNFSKVLWSSSGDGLFSSDSIALSTLYYPGTQDVLTGVVILTAEAFPMSPCGISVSNAHNLNVFNCQRFNLLEGWSGISSFIVPINDEVVSLFDAVTNDLIIMMKNDSGFYWPGQNINTIGNWNTHHGYIVKLQNRRSHLFMGTIENNKTLMLNANWNLIPVLAECRVDVTQLLQVDSFQIVKEVAGWRVYWPDYSINTLGYLEPGKSYYLRTTSEGTYTFPDCNGKNHTNAKSWEMINNSPWNDVHPTPDNHVVAIPAAVASQFEKGDIIGAFNASGLCAGMIHLAQDATAIVLNANDMLTEETEGFVAGEAVAFKLFRPATGEIFNLEVEYNPTLEHSGQFHYNALSAITGIKISPTGIPTQASQAIRIYPNPTTGLFTIEGVQKKAMVNVFNTFGVSVFGNEFSLPAQVDLSARPKGIYFIRIETDSETLFEKIIIN
jgi:hypothetical protein